MKGQFIDVKLDGQHTPDGMYRGDILHVEEPSVLAKKPGFAIIRVMLQVPVTVNPFKNQEHVPVYIVQDAAPAPDVARKGNGVDDPTNVAEFPVPPESKPS